MATVELTMKLWCPNKSQWWVIWLVTVPVLIGWIALESGQEQDERFLVALLIVGGLLVWRLQRKTENQDSGNDKKASARVPERVASFLRTNKPAAYCDGCIANALGLARHQQAQQATVGLGLSFGFTRQDGKCCVCGQDRLVISAN